MALNRWQAVLLFPLLLLACDDNPTEVPEVLTVELTVSPGHVHIWETEVTFTVEVRDSRDNVVTDFETLQVERRVSGSETWRSVELALQGDVYEGTYMFTSSGEYELQVTGMRPGEADAQVLHTAMELLHVVRTHAVEGGVRVEFETFPGHIHEDNTAALRFWVMEPDRNVDGVRPPITGLTGEIHCLEAGGADVVLAMVEIEPGVYEADHLFVSPGLAHVGLHFTAPDNSAAEAAFEIEIVHAH
jgi:hypothetical protein